MINLSVDCLLPYSRVVSAAYGSFRTQFILSNDEICGLITYGNQIHKKFEGMVESSKL
jgi:hypothetical protein